MHIPEYKDMLNILENKERKNKWEASLSTSQVQGRILPRDYHYYIIIKCFVNFL